MTDSAEKPADDRAGAALRALAKRGAAWSIIGFGGSQALRLLSNVVLTRLLFEEAFGLMALVAAFMTGLTLFSDIGIGPSIIQNERGDDPNFLNTAWTIQCGRGLALWLCSIAGTIPFAQFYGEPQLTWLIPVAGSSALIAGFNSTKLFTANRHLAMRTLSAMELASQLLGIVTMIVWALLHRSVWALVAGGLVTTTSKMLMSHWLLPGPANRFVWEADAVSRLVRFGRWIFVSTLLSFLTSHSDRLIFGKMIPVDLLGVYSVGATLAAVPSTAIGHISNSVLFPLYSRVVQQEGDLDDVVRRARWPLTVLGGWIFAGFIAGGQVIVDILYDARYADAGWVVQLLAMAGWFVLLESTAGATLLARGHANFVAMGSAAKLLGMVAFIPLGFAVGGFQGAVAAFAASELLRYLVSAWGVSRIGLRTWPLDLKLTLWVTTTAVAGGLAATWANRYGFGPVIAAILVFASITLLWAPHGLRAAGARRSRVATGKATA